LKALKALGKRYGYKGEYIYIRYEKVAHIVNTLKGQSVLHVGCGLGILDHYLSTNFTVHGIDISLKEVVIAQRIAKIFGRAISYEVADVLKYKPERKFDIVLCSEVIEHISAPEEEVIAVLKSFVVKDGFIVITVPNRDQLRNRVRRLFGMPNVLMDKTHLREYNRNEIEAIIQKSRLEIIKNDGAVLYCPLDSIFRIFARPRSFIRMAIATHAPSISSHLIYLCK